VTELLGHLGLDAKGNEIPPKPWPKKRRGPPPKAAERLAAEKAEAETTETEPVEAQPGEAEQAPETSADQAAEETGDRPDDPAGAEETGDSA